MIRLNISPLFVDHAEEVANDLRSMYENNIIDSTAFCCSFCPEGNPPIDKGTEFARRFGIFKKLLRDCGLPNGILIQSSMGHGWIPNSESPFQKIVKINGSTQYTMCPEDTEFRKYIYDAVAKCAKAEPDFFMLDDDTRLISGRHACFCPLHTRLFNEKYGTSFTSDELRETVKNDKAMVPKFIEMIRQSMTGYARVIRDAIDSVNPDLFCSFCQCSLDMYVTPDMAKILAGKGKKAIVRLNDGLYMQDSPRLLPSWLQRTAEQLLTLPEDMTVISEPDTCPHNRYSTSATFMRTHLTMSMMEGCKGGKLWITRLSEFEPASGKAYRKALEDDAGMMEYACESQIDWQGPQIPFPKTPVCYFNNYSAPPTGWFDVFGRLGLPQAYSRGIKQGHITLLSAAEINLCTDEELQQAFSGKVLLDGAGALALCKRGLHAYCGCETKEWTKAKISSEAWNGRNIAISIPTEMVELNPEKDAEILSSLLVKTFSFDNSPKAVAPGAVLYKNSLGGTVITLAMYCISRIGFSSEFNMMNEVRKDQLIEFLNKLQPMELYFEGDSEALLKYGFDKEERKVAELLNIELDPLEEITLRGTWTNNAQPQILLGNGSWTKPEFSYDAGLLTIKYKTLPARVTIFRV